jgi:ATP-binding cassette subfamily C protein
MSEAVVFACLIGLIIYINPSLAVWIFAFGALVAFLLSKFLLPMFYLWGTRSREASMMSWQHLLQFFHGFKDVVLLGKRAAFIDAYKTHALEQAHLTAVQAGSKALPRLMIEVLFVAIFIFVIGFLSYNDQPIVNMVGVLGGYLYAGFRLMPGLNRIIMQVNILKGSIPSIDRVYDEYMHVAKPENYADVQNFTFRDALELHNVSCSYFGTDQKTLSDICLTIKKGERIGIIGETGAGKSTLIDVILGLLLPQEGQVLVDGKYPASSTQWHSHIGYVPQNLYLTDNTIEENIALGVKEDEINRKRLDAAVEAAQLSELLGKLPQGLKTAVGERGVRLSGGERQRVAIARALYRDPDVLIFDEATSALDNATEKRLMKTINAVSQDRTVIMVAHRLSTLNSCDRIITLKNGSIEAIRMSIS